MKFFNILYTIVSFLTCNILFLLYSITEIIIFAIYINGGMEYEVFSILYMIIIYIIIFRYIEEMIDITKSFKEHSTRKMMIVHSIFTIATSLIIIIFRGDSIPLLLVYVPESIIYRIKCAKNKEEHFAMCSIIKYSRKRFEQILEQNDEEETAEDTYELTDDDFDD